MLLNTPQPTSQRTCVYSRMVYMSSKRVLICASGFFVFVIITWNLTSQGSSEVRDSDNANVLSIKKKVQKSEDLVKNQMADRREEEDDELYNSARESCVFPSKTFDLVFSLI